MTPMLEGSDPLFGPQDTKVPAERALGFLLIAMLVATALLLAH